VSCFFLSRVIDEITSSRAVTRRSRVSTVAFKRFTSELSPAVAVTVAAVLADVDVDTGVVAAAVPELLTETCFACGACAVLNVGVGYKPGCAPVVRAGAGAGYKPGCAPVVRAGAGAGYKPTGVAKGRPMENPSSGNVCGGCFGGVFDGAEGTTGPCRGAGYRPAMGNENPISGRTAVPCIADLLINGGRLLPMYQ